VAGLEAIAREIEVGEGGPFTAKEHPDVALVRLGLSSEHALELIGESARGATCPRDRTDPAYVHKAAKRGFAYITDATPEELKAQSTSPLQRFAEYHSLQQRSGVGRRSSSRRGS
jgi:hypothetical protein